MFMIARQSRKITSEKSCGGEVMEVEDVEAEVEVEEVMEVGGGAKEKKVAEVEEEVEGCRRTWHPVPMYAQKTDGIGGSRNTSPCTSFQPLSSSSSSSSSARAYREKSFLSTRIRMIERKPAAAAGGGEAG